MSLAVVIELSVEVTLPHVAQGSCRAGGHGTSRLTLQSCHLSRPYGGREAPGGGGTLSWIWGSVPLRGSLSHPTALTQPSELPPEIFYSQ